MPVIDLTRYIVGKAGTWTDPSQDDNLFGFTQADTISADRLLLRWAGDFVALTGPLRVRVTVQAENVTLPLAFVSNLVPGNGAVLQKISGTTAAAAATASISADTTLSEAALGVLGKRAGLSLQAGTIYSYTLDIAAGQAWPFSLSEQLDALRLRNLSGSNLDQLGNNLGFRVLIEPALALHRYIPVTPDSDLPCDFAVADRPDTARFFPSACEPCEGSVIGLSHAGSVSGVSPVAPPAEGGCVRTRFFNGMFITREDLETEQRYQRLKSKLHNRAAGAGVVWGFAVGKEGGRVCVGPGYGVDCCGNDLTLTTVYRVDVAALLADPAAASLVRQRGPHRMHLLLEYVECPSDPRPVHGDPCAPAATRCETSRVRESVRLRLVPPRDYDAAERSAPISRFLAEVRELRARFKLGDGPTVLGADRAPFRLHLSATIGGAQSTVTVRPSSQFDGSVFRPLLEAKGDLQSLTVDVIPDPLWTFVVGTVSGQVLQKGQVVGGAVQPADPVSLAPSTGFSSGSTTTTFTPGAQKASPDQVVFKVSGWQAQAILAAEDDPAPAGDLTVTFLLAEGRRLKEINLAETPIRNDPLLLARAPCSGEPCTPPPRDVLVGRGPTSGDCSPDLESPGAANRLSSADADPTPVLPWLHADPAHPAAAGDPKVLVLAALAAWLESMLVREQAGTRDEILSPRREIAQVIYRAAWLLLFGVSEGADAAALGCALRRLLEAWCDALLWKGPHCCGDPHGVVIGCTVVEGGRIREVDPFGGRRYVVHYPLLEHWGAQFGLAPLDVTAARFFSKLCCLAGLPALGVDRPDVPVVLVPLGNGYLAVGDPPGIAARLNEAKVSIVAQRKAAAPEMIASALALAGNSRPTTTAPSQAAQTRYTSLVLADFVADQTVMLLTPVSS
jgi:hypothetical protein